METKISTGNPIFDNFYPTIKKFLEHDQVTYVIDNEIVYGYRSPDCNAIWLRDHSDMLRGARYFDQDLTSAVTHFARTQCANGSIFDFVSCAMDRENWTKYVRVPVEADVEYRFIKAIYLAWQTTGDDEWLAEMMPCAEKAMNYIFTHPWRWSKEHGLVKRAYTIDTWDFDFVDPNQSWLNFQISDKTHWGIMHGDNSGYFEACTLLAKIYQHLKNEAKAVHWKKIAEGIRERTNRLCWNGRFYTHRVPLDGFRMPGVNEDEQLSLSNPMDINRGLPTHEMAVKIIQEYRSRKETTNSFAEWFSIDPPYPDGTFGDPKLVAGAYCNGGIMPLVGGELARAAFEHGFEAYGLETILKYANMICEKEETYLWYFPNGKAASLETSTSPDAQPTDGWGSSAMLYAFVEGLAGIVDEGFLFSKVKLSPRWAAANIERATVQIGYGASDSGFKYEFELLPTENKINLKLNGKAELSLHLLLPAGKKAEKLLCSGKTISFQNVKVEHSNYV
ncbi:MAG TPA: hypothetical protein VGD14_18800, partial [bacterium]